jgi:hypothetical protein
MGSLFLRRAELTHTLRYAMLGDILFAHIPERAGGRSLVHSVI